MSDDIDIDEFLKLWAEQNKGQERPAPSDDEVQCRMCARFNVDNEVWDCSYCHDCCRVFCEDIEEDEETQ